MSHRCLCGGEARSYGLARNDAGRPVLCQRRCGLCEQGLFGDGSAVRGRLTSCLSFGLPKSHRTQQRAMAKAAPISRIGRMSSLCPAGEMIRRLPSAHDQGNRKRSQGTSGRPAASRLPSCCGRPFDVPRGAARSRLQRARACRDEDRTAYLLCGPRPRRLHRRPPADDALTRRGEAHQGSAGCGSSGPALLLSGAPQLGQLVGKMACPQIGVALERFRVAVS